MENLMLTFIRVQKCMHIILCGTLKARGQAIDHNAVTLTFRHLISQVAIPEDKQETVANYINILKNDQKVRQAFGNAAHVKTIMMLKVRQFTEFVLYKMHLEKLGLPVIESNPDEFFILVDEFEHYAQKFRDMILNDSEIMENIRREYEDTSQLKAMGTGSGCLVSVIGFVTLPLLMMTLFVILV